VGLAVSGWQSSPYFGHKVTFLVVVFGIPILAVLLGLGWKLVEPAFGQHQRPDQGGVVERRPTYGPGVDPDALRTAKSTDERAD